MSISYHAHHSSIGSHSSFTLGMHNATGGFALEKGTPANGAVFVGMLDDDSLSLFPFFQQKETTELERFDHSNENQQNLRDLRLFDESGMTRSYRFATDTFEAEEISLSVISPFYSIPDPEKSDHETNKRSCCPSIFIKLKVDNRARVKNRKALFLLGQHGCPMCVSQGDTQAFEWQNGQLGIATQSPASSIQILDWTELLDKNFEPYIQGISTCFGFIMDVPAGQTGEMLITASTFVANTVTRGLEMKYWHSRYFSNIEDVMRYSLANSDYFLNEANARDEELRETNLNESQKFLVAHASHSYYGSTQWLDNSGQPFWVVNEGEYQMINTLDLTVDMLFYEMRYSPWTVRNVLENFLQYYSYYDEVYLPENPAKRYPGGISFTHDMGNRNIFSPLSYSSYERSGLDRKCFSHMTHEQLVNWTCCACVYCLSKDTPSLTREEKMDFLKKHLKTFKDCFTSLLNRDHPDPQKRTGVMSLESSRCFGGGEITTYDSLDTSLGQARQNAYLAVKTWAAYIGLSEAFSQVNETDLAREAFKSARLCATTVVGKWNDELGYVPAVFDGENTSAIIPAIEGLVFPKEMGIDSALDFDGEFSEFLRTLKKHFQSILKKGVCLYEDNGWKLSSTADNSWMSKICLCQHIARTILKIDFGAEGEMHDKAHRNWEISGSTYNACSDQFVSGVAKGSLYYPRIVTNILWLNE